MELLLIQQILIILSLSVAALYVCDRLGIPSIVGFLLSGLIAGPSGLGLVRAVEVIESLAGLGVVLLLFTIGLEFSLRSLLHIRRIILIGGSSQVVLTFLAAILLGRAFGRTPVESIFLGFLFSLSSTAIVMKILQDRGEVDTPHGHAALGILILQDILVVPMMLFTPILAGGGEGWGRSLILFIAEAAGIALVVKAGAKWIVPRVFFIIARTQIRELFLLSVILTCLAVAWVTSLIGLSLALGAFLAGLMISESEYSHQVIGNVLPFRDVFSSFFFVSVGMLLDARLLLQHPLLLILVALGVLGLKALLASLATAMTGLPLRTSILAGMALGQVGEFSFILSRAGIESGLLTRDLYQVFLAVSILTMGATPLMIAVSPLLAKEFLRLPLPRKWKRGSYAVAGVRRFHGKNHLVIVGFGVNGRNIARAAKVSGISYAVIEVNPEIVREESAKGEPIYYGDATQEAVLQHVQIRNARILVIAINDPAATRRITELARRLNPRLHIIVRTRFLREMEPLYALGANEVIPEEFETSIEIFSRVLVRYLHPREEIEKFIAEIRSEGYGMLRSLSPEATTCVNLAHCLPEMELASFRVAESAPLAGKNLAEAALPGNYGVTVLAIRRNTDFLYSPDPKTVLQPNDLLIVLGKPQDLGRAAPLFRKDGVKGVVR